MYTAASLGRLINKVGMGEAWIRLHEAKLSNEAIESLEAEGIFKDGRPDFSGFQKALEN